MELEQLVQVQRQQAQAIVKALTGNEIDLRETEPLTVGFLVNNFPEIVAQLQEAKAYPYWIEGQGDLLTILTVSQYPEDYEADLADAAQGIAFAYVHNMRFPACSEFGSVGVDQQLRRRF